jgi:hypothetical protein
MQNYHQIGTSRSQQVVQLFVHLLAAIAIYFYLTPAFLKCSALAALALSAFIDYRRLIRHDIIRVRVDRRQARIEIQQGGQSYFYAKYKVYQTRWFAILRLIDEPNNRTLILNSDCFPSTESYRQLRFDLQRLEGSDAA